MKQHSILVLALAVSLVSGCKQETKQPKEIKDSVKTMNQTDNRVIETKVADIDTEVKEPVRTSVDELSEQLDKSTTVRTSSGFMVPKFMKFEEKYGDDGLGTYDTYSWNDVMICYRFYGAWATMDDCFPKPNVEIAPFVNIQSITYHSPSKQIWPGYVSDGRIFYLKRKITVGENVDHALVLVAIYPKKYKKSATRLVNMVSKW